MVSVPAETNSTHNETYHTVRQVTNWLLHTDVQLMCSDYQSYCTVLSHMYVTDLHT